MGRPPKRKVEQREEKGEREGAGAGAGAGEGDVEMEGKGKGEGEGEVEGEEGEEREDGETEKSLKRPPEAAKGSAPGPEPEPKPEPEGRKPRGRGRPPKSTKKSDKDTATSSKKSDKEKNKKSGSVTYSSTSSGIGGGRGGVKQTQKQTQKLQVEINPAVVSALPSDLAQVLQSSADRSNGKTLYSFDAESISLLVDALHQTSKKKKRVRKEKTKTASNDTEKAQEQEVEEGEPKNEFADDGAYWLDPTKKDYYDESKGEVPDDASVQSAMLEEDICYECGTSTLSQTEWGSVILCDTCGGEYHLSCVGLECVPFGDDSDYSCPKCSGEAAHFSQLSFSTTQLGSVKPLKKIKHEKSFCYSPSRPLACAWDECTTKGFMVVSKALSFECMRSLTHGSHSRSLTTGRTANLWEGAVKEIEKRLSSATSDIINRDGRYDLKIPDYVVEACGIQQQLQPILSQLQSIMGTPTPQVKTHNVVFVPQGSAAQDWHVDDSIKTSAKGKGRHQYFTVLIHLNPVDSYGGGTEIWDNKVKKGDLIRARPGDALVFNGSMLHRGQRNQGHSHRYFYYCSYACKADANTGD